MKNKIARLLTILQLFADQTQVLLPFVKLKVEIKVKVMADIDNHCTGKGKNLSEVHNGFLADTISDPAQMYNNKKLGGQGSEVCYITHLVDK